MIANIVRMNSGRRKKEIILKGNKPIGWCRSVNSNLDNLGALNIEIFDSRHRYLFMCFDLETFPPVDHIKYAHIYVMGRKYKEEHDGRVRINVYFAKLPVWSNDSGFPGESYDSSNITSTVSVFTFDTGYSVKTSNITDAVKEMKLNNYNTLVLDSGYYNTMGDFFIQFGESYMPYIDFTLK